MLGQVGEWLHRKLRGGVAALVYQPVLLLEKPVRVAYCRYWSPPTTRVQGFCVLGCGLAFPRRGTAQPALNTQGACLAQVAVERRF